MQSAKTERLSVADLLTCLRAPSMAIYQPETLAPGTGEGVQVFTFDQETRSCGTVTRRYLAHVPESPDVATAASVVIGLPGQGANAESMREFQAKGMFDQLADRDGFVMVYGNGLPTPNNFAGRTTIRARCCRRMACATRTWTAPSKRGASSTSS